MSENRNFTSDEIRAMPVVDGPSPLCPRFDIDVSPQDSAQYWIDPITGIGYEIQEQDGGWVRYKNGMVDQRLAEKANKRDQVWEHIDFLPHGCGDAKMYVTLRADAMKPGDVIFFNPFELSRAFPFGWPSIYGNLTDSVMSSLIGSAYGRYKIDADYWAHGRFWFKISCHEPSDKIVYADPDRRHLYQRMPDGELIPNAVPFYEHVKSYRTEIGQ